jgi:hypothetical protein
MSEIVAALRGVWEQDRGGASPLDGIEVPQWIDHLALSANTAKKYTLPAGATKLLFHSNFDFYVNYSGADAAIPTEDVTDGSGAEFNPGGIRAITPPVLAVSIIAAAGGMITICAFK